MTNFKIDLITCQLILKILIFFSSFFKGKVNNNVSDVRRSVCWHCSKRQRKKSLEFKVFDVKPIV